MDSVQRGGGGRGSTHNPNFRTLGIGLLGGPLYITNINSTEIGYLKCMKTKLFYFVVQTLGGEGGVQEKFGQNPYFINLF